MKAKKIIEGWNKQATELSETHEISIEKWKKAYQGSFTLREAREIMKELMPKMRELKSDTKIVKRKLTREYDIYVKI